MHIVIVQTFKFCFQYSQETTGEYVIKSGNEVDKWASGMLFDLFFYASCIHANLHILQYLLTAALDKSSQDFEELNEWARFYATNLHQKYLEVGDELIRKQPDIFELFGDTIINQLS